MERWWPSRAEAEMLRFALPLPGLGLRFFVAGALFTLGLSLWLGGSGLVALLGLPLLLAGHLPLWVRGQTTAPGGATPAHEEVWAPVEEEWLARVEELERRGASWDATPWELTNARGCLTLVGVLAAVAGLAALLAVTGVAGPASRLAAAGVLLLAPQWLSGVRTTWNPSELRLKGESLAVARRVAERAAEEELEPVPLLALREGRRGRDYPVDARLMLKPLAGAPEGFLGVQVQVAVNNVRGTDYPYLYCVVLGREGFALPGGEGPWEERREGLRTVFEPGSDGEVRFLVVRRHADRGGGWHTPPDVVRRLVSAALETARAAVEENRR